MNERRIFRVLHTSDWHLGRTLHERARDDEFEAFLDWMIETVKSEKIDVLLIAGDIFDTSNPAFATQQRYFDFLQRLMTTCCRHAVITSGNHDSTSFIDVPGKVLAGLNIHVVGQARFGVHKDGAAEEEVVVIQDEKGRDALIVAAVPFLTEGDLRFSEFGESREDKERKMIEGVKLHYDRVAEAAEKIRDGRDIPVIAMGHLFVQGGKFDPQNGSERQTYIGTLGGVSASSFSPSFDYVALGHLHGAQCVGGNERVRYSGSPIAMGFGEAGQSKSVYVLDCDGRNISTSAIPVPCFHKIVRIEGDKSVIEATIQQLIRENEDTYISVTYTGEQGIGNLIGYIDALVGDSRFIHCLEKMDKSLAMQGTDQARRFGNGQKLSEIKVDSVFELLLQSKNFDEEKARSIRQTFQDLLLNMVENHDIEGE